MGPRWAGYLVTVPSTAIEALKVAAFLRPDLRFDAGDPYLGSDVVFGVKDSLVRPLACQQAETTERGATIGVEMMALRYDFVLADARAAP